MDQARRWPVRFVRAALCCSACASEGASALPFMWLPGFATVPSGVREYCRTVLFSSNRYRSTQSSSCSTTCSRCSRMKRWVVAVPVPSWAGGAARFTTRPARRAVPCRAARLMCLSVSDYSRYAITLASACVGAAVWCVRGAASAGLGAAAACDVISGLRLPREGANRPWPGPPGLSLALPRVELCVDCCVSIRGAGERRSVRGLEASVL